jgi:hypothetical protein
MHLTSCGVAAFRGLGLSGFQTPPCHAVRFHRCPENPTRHTTMRSLDAAESVGFG